jgi:hypothetical protein
MLVIPIAANGFSNTRRVWARVVEAGILATVRRHQLSLYKPASAASILCA